MSETNQLSEKYTPEQWRAIHDAEAIVHREYQEASDGGWIDDALHDQQIEQETVMAVNEALSHEALTAEGCIKAIRMYGSGVAQGTRRGYLDSHISL